MNDKWIRFDESDRAERRKIDSDMRDSRIRHDWLVMWDGYNEIHLCAWLAGLGGAGWYAIPDDVITLPKDRQ